MLYDDPKKKLHKKEDTNLYLRMPGQFVSDESENTARCLETSEEKDSRLCEQQILRN